MKTIILLLVCFGAFGCSMNPQTGIEAGKLASDAFTNYLDYKLIKKYPVDPYKISTDEWMVDPESGK